VGFTLFAGRSGMALSSCGRLTDAAAAAAASSACLRSVD
jgi:hypothetical protein